jgi:hypothetical protein
MADEQRKTGGPIGGTPESAAWFRLMLENLGETQSSLARLMHRKGDDRQPTTILRTIQRMANGEARVSGEMRVILTMMLRAKQRGERRTAAKAAELDETRDVTSDPEARRDHAAG